MAKKALFPDELLRYYDLLISSSKDIARKGVTMQYTSLHGHMFSFLDKDHKFGLRLPEKVRDEFIKKFKTSLFVAHDIVLKEYVLVPDELYKNTKLLLPYFKQSYEYVKSLKPKVSVKEKTAKSKN
jgi:hypothetical protein